MSKAIQVLNCEGNDFVAGWTDGETTVKFFLKTYAHARNGPWRRIQMSFDGVAHGWTESWGTVHVADRCIHLGMARQRLASLIKIGLLEGEWSRLTVGIEVPA